MPVKFRNAFPGDNYVIPSGELSKDEYVSWSGNPFLTDKTRQYVRDVYMGAQSFGNGKNAFGLRVPITRRRVPGTYYRKMSQAEFAKIGADGVLGAALKYNNTKNYRVWMSTSLGMVTHFFNFAATQAQDVIVEMVYNADLFGVAEFECKPHQNQGGQSDPSVAAIHGEDFAHIGVVDDTDIDEIRDKGFDYNIGVCSALQKKIEDRLVSHRRIN